MQQCCADCHAHDTTQPSPSFLSPQVDGWLRTPFMLVGLCLASGMFAAKGELSGSSAALQALLCGKLDAAVWLLQQPGGARLDVFADWGTYHLGHANTVQV